MLLVSDIHAAFGALRRVTASGETVLILGDLVNLTDYRTGDGLIADTFGDDFARETSDARGRGDFGGMRQLWEDMSQGDWDAVRATLGVGLRAQYEECRRALEGGRGYIIHGNVDHPALLQEHLPDDWVFADGLTFEIEGMRIGFAGGGVPGPFGGLGDDDEMRHRLEGLGEVEILCTHIPPAVDPLQRDTITGRLERGSIPVLEFLETRRPRLHFFGDVHQPQATVWRVGDTLCRNLGYFRATGRPLRLTQGA